MAEKAEALSNQVSADDSSIDQLRDILFGAQRREYDSRLKRLEELITQNHKHLQTEIGQQISSLRDELLKAEENARSMAIEELSDRMNSAFERLNIENNEQQTATTTELSELRQQLDASEYELRTAFTENQQQLENMMNEHLAALDKDKINKSTLSEMLLTLVEGIKKG